MVGVGLWGCRCCGGGGGSGWSVGGWVCGFGSGDGDGGGGGWSVGGWVCVAGLGFVRVGCCRVFGFRGVVVGFGCGVVVAGVVSCWVGFGRGWVVPEGIGTGIETPFLCLNHGRNPPP
ncbi:hypothetical protein FCV25MIE_07816 [Fagus crenata]